MLTGFVVFDETSTNGTANAMVVLTFGIRQQLPPPSPGTPQGGTILTKYVQVVPHTFNVSQTAGRNGTSWTVFNEYHPISTNSVTGESYILAYGQNVTLKTSPTNTVSAPRVMTAKPQEIFFGANGPFLDSTLTAVFDSKDTIAANGQNLTINDVADSLRQKYLSLGYIETSPLW